MQATVSGKRTATGSPPSPTPHDHRIPAAGSQQCPPSLPASANWGPSDQKPTARETHTHAHHSLDSAAPLRESDH